MGDELAVLIAALATTRLALAKKVLLQGYTEEASQVYKQYMDV